MITTIARRFPKATTLLLGLSILVLAGYCAHQAGLLDFYAHYHTLYVLVGAGQHNVELGLGAHGGLWFDEM